MGVDVRGHTLRKPPPGIWEGSMGKWLLDPCQKLGWARLWGGMALGSRKQTAPLGVQTQVGVWQQP